MPFVRKNYLLLMKVNRAKTLSLPIRYISKLDALIIVPLKMISY